MCIRDRTSSNLTTSTTTAKVGLLRLGELMAEQFDKNGKNATYWTLTPYSSSYVRNVSSYGGSSLNSPANSNGSRPSMNLKSNVVITGGDGTKNNPFQVKLGS